MNGLSYFALQPLSELSLWGWRLERRTEFLWRDQFDRVLLPPLFGACQALLNAGRKNEHLALAQELVLPDEERCIQQIIDEIAAFMKENWLPGSVQRFGNTKTYGVVRGELRVRDEVPEHLRRGIFAKARTFPAWVRFAGPGPYAPPDLYDYGQCSVGIKLMDVPGPKLLDDERFTQDLIMVTPASFVTPNVQENAKLQRYVRARTNLFYFVNPSDTHVLAGLMQALFSRMQTSPLEPRYYSNVPFLLGEGQAVQYSLRPSPSTRTRIPARASDNYLRETMARTLAKGPWSFDLMVQPQTDAHRMPIEDATVKWPEKLSPYVPVAELHLPRQRFESPAQMAFADNLSYNPWHSLPEHRPLGNQNRARRRMYQELSRLRQAMNEVPHIEPTGQEHFGRAPAANGALDGAKARARVRAQTPRPRKSPSPPLERS